MSDDGRIVVTGIGIVSPIGIGKEDAWRAAAEGRSGAGPIEGFDASDQRVRVACEVGDFEPADFMGRKNARRMERFSQFAVAAAQLAVDDAGLSVNGGEGIGAVVGTGTGGSIIRDTQHDIYLERGADRISPFTIPQSVPNMGSAMVSIELGLRGPVLTTSTACAAGTDAIGTAMAMIRRGSADVILAGGAEAMITPFWVAGFDAMRVLSRRNEDATTAGRPFDAGRDGFLIGEGGAILVLERLEGARSRGAEPICEVLGYGASADAYHFADPDPSGVPQARAVAAALADADLEPADIGYVNAHGGASEPGDPAEILALRQALGESANRTAISSTKAIHGHCLGAAGAVEGALTALAVHHGFAPPTANLDDLDPECAGLDHVVGEGRSMDLRAAMSTSFGLGGHNAALVFGAPDRA
ncbi:MAG: beta-ketoacyl-ACP synthase II [Miltoncostaeaceae bacterium]